MARKGGLGKGLDALIPSKETPQAEMGVSYLGVDQIVANPRQPRQVMDADDLQELAASIREHGILQPLIVTLDPETGQSTLIAGERRLRAARLAGLQQVPVLYRQVTDQERLELALIENVQRADLSPLETAEAYRQLNEEFNISHDEIALRVGKSRTAVTNTLRLLKLAEPVRLALAEGKISEGHARALLGLTSVSSQAAALQVVVDHELSVRQTEEYIRKLNGIRPPAAAAKSVAPELEALEDQLRSHLGTRVTLHKGKKGGSITIHFFSDEELDALVSQIIRE
jgi:ParB family transcriptional regulator, chromosome partitioning protein